MLMRKMLVLAKVQAAFDTPAVPVVGTDAILARTAMPSPLSAEFIQRTLLKGVKGNFGTFAVGEHRAIEFETELAHTGAAGTASPLAVLLKSAGWNETINAGVSAVYGMTSADCPYVTLYCYLDKVLFQIQNAWGTVSFELNPKGIAVAKWRFIGKYVAMTDVNVPTNAVFTAFLKPTPLSKANTPTFTVHGVAVKASAFSVDTANELQWRELLNDSGPQSNDRRPTARCTFELTTVAAKAWAETVRLNTEAAIQMIHGVGAGNIVQLDAPKAQFTAEPSITEVGGRAFLNGQMSLNPNAGDDELVLTFK